MPPDTQGMEGEISLIPPEDIMPEYDEKAIRLAEIERKKADLRIRMEAASKLRKLKKGFMTPERKKKLRLLLRKKAAEELKKEQERKAEERRWIIEERCGDPEDTEWASKDDLIDICEYYFQRILEIEADKWDLEYEIRKRAIEILDLNGKVNDLRGKFQKPILKKISKYENKFAKLQRKAAEFNFKNQLMIKRTNLCKDDRRSHSNRTSRACSCLPTLKMTARCASCNYPLTISDSVVCYECHSYFHIDCAQLVGFPFYPQSNTFHCSTCKLLPLPHRVDSDSDSDSDSDGAMPSRHLDYNMEDRPDFTNDMNEVKGSVQDLSNLCKDMLREINELKSINLTLRCSVENLRHDSSRRDGLIADLQVRIEALEKTGSGRLNIRQESTDWSLDSVVLEKEEELERFSTPEPPDVNDNIRSTDVYSPVKLAYHHEAFTPVDNECETSEDQICDKYDSVDEAQRENYISGIEHMSSNIKESAIQDWTWKGNDAVEIKRCYYSDQNERNDCDDEENRRSSGDEEWENNVVEECTTGQLEKTVQESTEESINHGSYEDEDEEDEDESEEEKTQYDMEEMKLFKRNMGNIETFDEAIEDCEEDLKADEDSKEINQSQSMENKPTDLEVRTELGSELESIATLDERELSERLHVEELSAIDESLPTDEHLGDQESHPAEETSFGDDLDPADDGVVKHDRAEGDVHEEGEFTLGETEPQLEGEAHRDVESGELLEGEGGQISGEHPGALDGDDQGLIPSEESIEILEPPAEPQHTESDLWDYLKDTVSSVHPSTVEEFLENLIGTLQHVPEEYFKPVIDANIRRATSPSVTDGEHLPPHDDTNEGGEATDNIDSQPKPTEEECPATSEEVPSPSDPQADDGYTPVEVSD